MTKGTYLRYRAFTVTVTYCTSCFIYNSPQDEADAETLEELLAEVSADQDVERLQQVRATINKIYIMFQRAICLL
jgi:hypothetical protein